MPTLFKLMKVNTLPKLSYFLHPPSWEEFRSDVAERFHIPVDQVGAAFVDGTGAIIKVNEEHQFTPFLQLHAQNQEMIKVVVQDVISPDRQCSF
jgi:hypothetical protein